MVNSMHPYMLKPDQLESRLAESNIRVLTDTKSALMERVGNSIMGCIRKSITSRLRVILPSTQAW